MSEHSTVQWWPMGEPVPDGWHIREPQVITHHSRYSYLIEKDGEEELARRREAARKG